MSWDSFIDFIKEQEAMGVNVTFSSSEIEINKEIVDAYKKDKEEGILTWIAYLRNALDEFAEDRMIEALTSGTVDEFVKKFGIHKVVGIFNEYPDLCEMLFKESEHISIKFFDKLIRAADSELYRTYLGMVCCNEKLREDDNDGFESLLRELSRRMWLAEPDNYDEFAKEIESYISIVTKRTASVIRFYLAKNNESIDADKKIDVYEQYFDTMKSVLASTKVLSEPDQSSINECLDELIKLDLEAGSSAWIDVVTISNRNEIVNSYLEEEICRVIPNHITKSYGPEMLISIIEDNEDVYKKVIATGEYVPNDFLRKLYKEYSAELFIKYFYPILRNVRFTSNDDGYYLKELIVDLGETAPADRRLYTVLQTVLNKLSEELRSEVLDNIGSLKQPKIKISKTKKKTTKRKESEPDPKIAIDMLRKKMAETKEYFALSKIIKEDEIREALREYKENNELETIDIIRGKRNADREDFFDFLMGIYFAKNVLDNNDNDIDFSKYDRSSDSYKDEAETYLEELSEYEDLGIDIEDLGLDIDDVDLDEFDKDDFENFDRDEYDRDEFGSDYDSYDSGLSFDFDSGGFGDGDY